MIELIQKQFGQRFEKELFEEIIHVANYHEVKDGEKLMQIGQNIRSMPLLITGNIKISRSDEENNELFLYYLQPGQTCSISLNCVIGNQKSQINAVSEGESSMLLIPIQKMEEWMKSYRTWREFVMESHLARFEELIVAIDGIAFSNMDDRIVQYLKKKSDLLHSKQIQITHQEIATDLNTSRVVISRLLKQLERNGAIQLGRNSLSIIEL